MFGLGLVTRVLAVVGVIALVAAVFIYYPSLLPLAQTEWSKVQPPRCATASECVFTNNSCCSNQSGNWTCAALDAHCAPGWAAHVAGCWCGNGLCAANYSCEPERPTPTVDLPPFPPEDLEGSPIPSPSECILNGSTCCIGSDCKQGIINVLCIQGTEARFTSCNENCSPRLECVPIASPSPDASPSPSATAQIANPASVYCAGQGGSLEIVDSPAGQANAGQVGYCFFVDGSVCEEWKFFRGECAQGSCKYYCGGKGSASEGLYDCNDALLVAKKCV